MIHRQNTDRARRIRSSGRIAPPWLVWGGIAVLAIAAVIVATASRSESSGESLSGQSASQRIAAPDFELTLYQGADVLGGEKLKFSDVFSQSKPVVLNFYAGLCPPCRAEMPGFQRVYDELGEQFVLFGLDIGPFIGLGSNEDGRSLLRELNITYPAGTTTEASIVAQYQVRGMPTTVFITSAGEISDVHTGLLDEATLRNKVRNLIQASEASSG